MIALAGLVTPRVTALLAGCCLALGLYAWSLNVRLGAAERDVKAQTQRISNLDHQVELAAAGLRECGVANASRDQALQACHAHTGDLARETRRLEQLVQRERATIARSTAEDDAEERTLLGPLGVPPVDEINATLRRRGEGWLWR